MRQIGDLAVWLGMIGMTAGVVRYAPVVADLLTPEAGLQVAPSTVGPEPPAVVFLQPPPPPPPPER